MTTTVPDPSGSSAEDTPINLPKRAIVDVISDILTDATRHPMDPLVAAAVDSVVGTLLARDNPGDAITLPYNVVFFLDFGSNTDRGCYQVGNEVREHPSGVARRQLFKALIERDSALYEDMCLALSRRNS